MDEGQAVKVLQLFCEKKVQKIIDFLHLLGRFILLFQKQSLLFSQFFGRFDLNIAIACHDCLEGFLTWIFKVEVSDGILDMVLNGTAGGRAPIFGS